MLLIFCLCVVLNMRPCCLGMCPVADGGQVVIHMTRHTCKQTRQKKRRERRRQTFLSAGSLCQPCKKAAKPIILSSSFFSGAAESSLDCHMYKGSPYKAIHSTEWTRHLWGFLISSSLFFSFFFKPCNQIWAKSNGGRIEWEQWGGGGFNESTFCWSETSK